MVGSVLMQFPDRGDLVERREALAEAADVLHGPAGLELLAEVQRAAGDRAGLVDLSGGEVSVREDHGHEEVAADRGSGSVEGPLSIGDGVGRAVEVAEAVAEFRAQLGVIEVGDPVRIVAGLAALEDAYRFGQRTLGADRVAAGREGAGLHGVEVGREGGGGASGGTGTGGPGEVGGPPVPAEEGRPNAHPLQNASAE